MTIKTTLIQLGTLSLAIQSLFAPAAAVPAPTHHLIAIDISGSMYSDLPQLRTHLKNKLATLVQDNDTVSIIWFSGRGQVGTLVEALKIRGVADLSALHKAIDRFLVATGLTGFKEPLQEVERLIDGLKAKGPAGNLFNLFFMSDGYDNVTGSDKEILDLCARLEKKLDNAAVVEFGYHANRPLLTKMAATLGGKLVFSDDFESYTVAFEGSMGGSTKKVPVKLGHALAFGTVFALVGTNVLTFTPDADGVVLVPEGLTDIAFFTTAPGAAYDRAKHVDPLVWASLAPLAQDLDSDKLFTVLGALGDVALVNQFGSSFSKEDYSRFTDSALAAATDTSKRYVDGYDAHAVPKEDAYTVLHLLADLSSSEQNLVYPYHPSWSYERIGAATQAVDEKAKFEVGDRSMGYPVNGLVWSEDRPNVSLRLRIEGDVTLPASRPAGLPATIPSFIYRAYTIIRDGIVHTRQLPVSLSEDTFKKLADNGLLVGEVWAAGKVFELKYPKVPVINRLMVKGTTAATTFAKVVELAKLKASQKVFNDYRDRLVEKESSKFIALYGVDAPEYLTSVGVTEGSGYSPASVTVKSGDYYLATELKIAVKGLSSLPKVADVEAVLEANSTVDPTTGKAKKKPLKLGEHLMAPALGRIEEFMSLSAFSTAAASKTMLVNWLDAEGKEIVKRTRELIQELAQTKFAVVVGHTWFTDLGSFENTSMEVEVPDFGKVPVTATLKSVQIAL